MSHWSQAYVGLPWIEGQFDCADLVAKVRREVFGQEITLPTDHGEGPFGRSATIARHVAEYAAPTEAPQEGDGVLLIARGRVQHIGLLCVIGSERWVLHNCQTKEARARGEIGRYGQSVLTRERDLERFGYRIEGYYRWI